MIVDSAFHLKDVTSDKCVFISHILIGSHELHPKGTRSLILILIAVDTSCPFTVRLNDEHRLMTFPEMYH